MPKPEFIVNSSQLAAALDLTNRRINQLAKERVLPRLTKPDGSLKENSWNLGECLAEYLHYRRSRLTKSSAEVTLAEEKLKLLRARADQARIRCHVLGEGLMPARYVRGYVEFANQAMKDRLTTMIANLAPKLVKKKDIPAVWEIVEKDLYATMTSLIEDLQEEPFLRLHPEFGGEGTLDK
jgi:hypothetical protein